jgi:two-component system, NarL family, sensor histidine kinase DegS
MPDDPPIPPAGGLEELIGRLAGDLATLDVELAEIELLVNQARAESARHESRRTTATSKLEALGPTGDPLERLELTTSLVTLTKRSALMDAQVEVLDGKHRALARYRDAVASYGETLAGIEGSGGTASTIDGIDPDAPIPPGMSRLLLSAQEDLRREIARAMHDGPAQSLTNIVLQAQIVERLVVKDPSMAAGEVRQLIAMVQSTLDATKSFIFDVRPMVLDDLGLVPTLRRAARDRGRKAGVPVEFESMGQDRRLPMDLESGLFRMLDEGLAGFLAVEPERVSLHLDWGDQLEARLVAVRSVTAVERAPGSVAPTPTDAGNLPPALAAMMEERRADEREAVEAAERNAIVVLPATTWREIQGRAMSVGVTVELIGGGGEIRLLADIPPLEAPGV